MPAVMELTPAMFRAFAAKAGRLPRSFVKPLKIIRLLAVSAAKQCFDRGSDPNGVAWLPLARERRRNRGRGRSRPLRDTGLLMSSITGTGANHFEQLTETRLEVGSNLFYASFHQYGTKTIPARPFLGWSPALLAKCEQAMLDYLEEETAKALAR